MWLREAEAALWCIESTLLGKERPVQKKKITLMGAIMLGIGSIMGTGIFGTIPTVISQYREAVIWALILAALNTVRASISTMYTSAAIPVSASGFMWATKLLHPCAGMFMSVSYLLSPILISMFGVLFATYLKALFPQLEVESRWISVTLLLVFFVIAWFGNKSTVRVSNIMSILLVAAIGGYVVLGVPHINWDYVNWQEVIRPSISLSGIGAAMGVLTTSLSGGTAVAQVSDDIESPERNVPIAVLVSPLIVAGIYTLISIVTLGIIPSGEIDSLAVAAERFMSSGALRLFIIVGPICGVIAALVPVMLDCVAMFDYSSRNYVLPKVFSKKNSHGVAYFSLLAVIAIATLICASGAEFGVLITAFSFCNTLINLPYGLYPIFAYKKYPQCCKHSSVKLPYWFIFALGVLGVIISAYLALQLALTLRGAVLWLIIGVYVVGALYLLLRIAYLRKRGVEVLREMKEPFGPWERKEASYSQAVK